VPQTWDQRTNVLHWKAKYGGLEVSEAKRLRIERQVRVSQALGRIRQFACRQDPRWEPYAGKPPVLICAGGAS
jgi:hypothetical protein